MLYKVVFIAYDGKVYAWPDTNGHKDGEVQKTINDKIVYVDAESKECAKHKAIEILAEVDNEQT